MIKIYTIPNCDRCDEAKQILKERNIEYQEFNLKEKENRDIRAHYRSLGATSAPVIVCQNFVIVNYSKEALIKLLTYDYEGV